MARLKADCEPPRKCRRYSGNPAAAGRLRALFMMAHRDPCLAIVMGEKGGVTSENAQDSDSFKEFTHETTDVGSFDGRVHVEPCVCPAAGHGVHTGPADDPCH